MARHLSPGAIPKNIPTWEYNAWRRVFDALASNDTALAAVARGEIPDGSGDPIASDPDLSLYFYLPGRNGGQTGNGDTVADGSLIFSSTADDAKGFIHLGNPTPGITLDENLSFIGINQPVPAAPLHIRIVPELSVISRPTTPVGSHIIGVLTIVGLPLNAAIDDVTPDEDITYCESDDSIVGFARISLVRILPPDGVSPDDVTDISVTFRARRTSDVPSGKQHVVSFSNNTVSPYYNLDGGALSQTLNDLTTSYVDYSFSLSPTGVAEWKAAVAGGFHHDLVIQFSDAYSLLNLVRITQAYVTFTVAAPQTVWRDDNDDDWMRFSSSGLLTIGHLDVNSDQLKLLIKGATGQSVDLQQWLTASSVVSVVDSGAKLGINTSGASLAAALDVTGLSSPTLAATIKTGVAGNRGLLIAGFAAQTADLLQLSTSAGGVRTIVDAAGRIGVNTTSTTLGATLDVAAISSPAIGIRVLSGATGVTGILIRDGASDPTAPSLEIQDSSTTTKVKFAKSLTQSGQERALLLFSSGSEIVRMEVTSASSRQWGFFDSTGLADISFASGFSGHFTDAQNGVRIALGDSYSGVRTAAFSSPGGNILTRLGIMSHGMTIQNDFLGNLVIPGAVLRVVNSSANGANGTVVQVIQSQRSGQTADLLQITSAVSGALTFAVDASAALEASIKTASRIVDSSDLTKKVSLDVAGVDTATTRADVFPNQAGTIQIGAFALTSDDNVNNSTTETDISNAGGQGSLTINAAPTGRTVRVTASGTIGNVVNDTIQLRLKHGGTTVLDTGAYNLGSACTHWRFMVDLTWRSSTTVSGAGWVEILDSSTGAVYFLPWVAAAVSVSATGAISLTAQWGGAGSPSASDTITTTNFVVETIY